MISRGMMERQLYADGTIPDVYEDPVTNLAYQIGVTTDEARRIINTMENPYKMMDMLPPNPRDEFMNGGIASLRQQYGLGGFVKSITKGIKGAVSGVTDAVTDFAKSDIGQIALAVAAPYALGAYVPGFATLGGTGFMGNALRAGIGNLAVQGLTTGRFDLGQAAKSGIIQGGIQTGLQRGFGPKTTRTDLTQGDVTTGGDVLKSTVVQDPSIDFEGVQYADAAQAADAFTPTPSMEGFTQAPTISPTQTTEGVMGLDTVYGGPEYTASTLPETGIDTMGVAQASEIGAGDVLPKTTAKPTFDFDPSEPIGGAVGMEPIQGKFGQTVGTRFTDPITGATSVVKGGVADIPLADRAGQFSTEIKDVFREGATLAQRKDSALNALKQISGAALDRPLSTVTIASLLSAASVPQQPDETDFDYEERMKLVNEYSDYYGQRAGVDMSGTGDITDYETYYSERAGVAEGGSPEVPTGNVRENQAGIMELDYRDTGGRVPIGIKERADDVPAMLSKDEFVFTSKAVKNAGNGDVDKGAEKLYSVMKTLENGGTV